MPKPGFWDPFTARLPELPPPHPPLPDALAELCTVRLGRTQARPGGVSFEAGRAEAAVSGLQMLLTCRFLSCWGKYVWFFSQSLRKLPGGRSSQGSDQALGLTLKAHPRVPLCASLDSLANITPPQILSY